MTEKWEVEAPISPVGDHELKITPYESEEEVIAEDTDVQSLLGESEGSLEDESEFVVKSEFTKSTPIEKLTKVLNEFPSKYGNIISEFADVEIFLISLDGLLVELTAHEYLNWELGGQTIILSKQIDTFLHQLGSLGGRFKLIWFTGLRELYEKDPVLRLVRSFVEVHLLQSEWANDVVEFNSILDPEWPVFLQELTPSFLMISVDNFSGEVSNKNLDFCYLLTSIALDTLCAAIPVVHIYGLVINICSVQCHRVEPAIVNFTGWENYLEEIWCQVTPTKNRSRDLSHCKNLAEFWAEVIKFYCNKRKKIADKFEQFASAVLVYALVSGRLGIERTYLPKGKSKDDINKVENRRELLTACAETLDTLDFELHPPSFNLDDLWDGQYVSDLYDQIVTKKKVLPLRLQEEFAKLHGYLKLKYSLPTDVEERLFNPVTPTEDGLKSIIDNLLVTKNDLLKNYAPEFEKLFSSNSPLEESKLFETFNESAHYHVHLIPEEFTERDNNLSFFRQAKNKQRLYKWWQDFSESLEGKGSSLLVDFSKRPLHVSEKLANDEVKKPQDTKKEKQKSREGKGKKEPVKSKKELILEANKKRKNAKIIQDESNMIEFAASQGNQAVKFLENIMIKLETPESRSRCVYEQARSLLQRVENLEGDSNLESRRVHAVPLVGKLKDLRTQYWNYLGEKQKDFVKNTWKLLGFEREIGSAPCYEEKLSLRMNMVYYQLAYGGQTIDIQLNPRKDSRVTGFHPDEWQLDMLNAVDEKQSAVIIAPTSAGKTFVSFYCIEGILRNSDEDIVVYVSPSKALINQVCGSVYARFRNKTMSGGKALFGTLTMDYNENAMNCQVLITVPECLEKILLSSNPAVRAVAAKIKYAIFDEVHCINASPEAHIWEHLFLLIQCPFLALSATVGNADALHEWLETTENSKTKRKRKVALIRYNERYSELELFIQRIKDMDTADNIAINGNADYSVLDDFMPYGIFKPLKLAMFGIPADQQLTARQILNFYYALSDVDPSVKDEFEPCKFFGYEGVNDVWLTRAALRKLENGLKDRFIDWLKHDIDKFKKVLDTLNKNIKSELEYRSVPFNQARSALKNIVNLVVELRKTEMLPAICFIDDRSACKKLATKLFEYYEEEQRKFEATAKFKAEFEIKDEEKLLKLVKRKRDIGEKKSKIKSSKSNKRGEYEEGGEQEYENVQDEIDPLAGRRLKLREVLAKFRLQSRHYDEELVQKVQDRLRYDKHRETTKLLLKLFERGIAFHHAGLNARERCCIEILFRAGYIGMLFSTSTLALGINMPCKTVLFGLDTPGLTPLQFRQMSGRAGRRGFDSTGNVIFMSIPTAKMRRLLTASLSTLRGNLPFTTTYVLRLFMFVFWRDETAENTSLETTTGIKRRLKAALALFKNSFMLYTHVERKREALLKQTKLFTLYSVQLLRWLDLLDAEGIPKGLAPVVVHLSAHEPGNLIFIYLLQKGVFHRLCNRAENGSQEAEKEDPRDLKSILVAIFAHLFTNRRLPLSWNPEDEASYPSGGNATIFLRDLPEECKRYVDEYNRKVEELWRDYLTLVRTDEDLHIRKNVYSLTGKPQFSLSSMLTNVVQPFEKEFLYDEGLFPVCLSELIDYRGNRIYRNAYAYDFWVSGSKELLRKYNNIGEQSCWFLIHDFVETLQKISRALSEVSRSTDSFTRTMLELSNEYDKKFKRAFGMKLKDERN